MTTKSKKLEKRGTSFNSAVHKRNSWKSVTR